MIWKALIYGPVLCGWAILNLYMHVRLSAHTQTRRSASARNLVQRPDVVTSLINLTNSKPAQSNDSKIVKKRYLNEPCETTIEVLYNDYLNKLIEILPNKPFMHKGQDVSILDSTFLKYILRAKVHQKKCLTYCLE